MVAGQLLFQLPAQPLLPLMLLAAGAVAVAAASGDKMKMVTIRASKNGGTVGLGAATADIGNYFTVLLGH